MNSPVDWQISKKKVKQRGQYLLETGLWSDCSFIVGVEPHHQIFNGHKLFLAMSSPVFEAMFFGRMAEKNDQPIPILDVQPEAFKALLEYIYTDNIILNSFDQACELCYGAKKYMLPHLVEECTNYLWSDLYSKNACRAYEFAKLFEEPVLMDKSLQIICTQTQEVLNESNFEDIELDTLLTIYSQENLAIDSELDLFNALVRYAAKHGNNSGVNAKKPRLESNGNNSNNNSNNSNNTNNTNNRNNENVEMAENNTNTSNAATTPTVRDALKKIRFLTLTPQQFADGPALSDLLTQSEKFDIFMNISSQMNTTSMPEGFSTLKKSRRKSCGQFRSVNTPQHSDDLMYPQSSGMGSRSLNDKYMDHHNRDSNRSMRVFLNSNKSNDDFTIDLVSNSEDHTRNLPKYYCTRTLIQKTDCLNSSVIDCTVTFSVDRNICILGLQVPAQVLCDIGDQSTHASSSMQHGMYSELLYAHLVDGDGSRLTYLHYTARVSYRSIIELLFYRPVYIQRHKEYKMGVVFNRNGWYPIGTCAPTTTAASVTFTFTNDSVRDGLIRSIIFSY